MAYDNTNKGILSKNDRKEKDTHPDQRGSINVEGVEYWLDGWIKERNDGTGKFLSLSVKRKDAARAPAPAKAAPSKAAPQGFDDVDDGIPW
jgi:hypothetical protein